MNKKIKAFIAVLTLGLVLITIGVTVAFFNYVSIGNTENTLIIGDNLKLHYSEISGIGRGIVLSDGLPVSDNNMEKTNDKYFEFSIEGHAKGTDLSYIVTARKSNDSDDIDNYTEKVIYKDTIKDSEDDYNKNFRLRMWIDENTNFSGVKNSVTGEFEYPYQNKTFKITINVYSGINDSDYDNIYEPGLYNSDGKMLANWDALVNKYGVDFEKDYAQEDYDIEDMTPLNPLLYSYATHNNEELRNGKLLVLGNNITRLGDFSLIGLDVDKIVIPNSVESIGNYALTASKFKNVEFVQNSKLKTIGIGAFGATTIKVLEIPNSVITIGENAFYDIPVVIYSGLSEDTNNDNWGASAIASYQENDVLYDSSEKNIVFGYIGNESSIVIPNTVEQIWSDAFSDNSTLINVIFEEESQLKNIGKNAFKNTRIESISIPTTVNEIGTGAFTNIKYLYYTGSATDTNNDNWGAQYRNLYVGDEYLYYDSDKTITAKYIGTDTSVVVPSNVIVIGNGTFGNTGVVSVTIPNSVQIIGSKALLGENSRLSSNNSTNANVMTLVAHNNKYSIDKVMISNWNYKIVSLTFENTFNWKVVSDCHTDAVVDPTTISDPTIAAQTYLNNPGIWHNVEINENYFEYIGTLYCN